MLDVFKQDLGGKSSYFKQERKAFGECWLNVLSMKLPDESVDQVLSNLPEKVIPNMPEPIRLSDFLLSAYNRGGISAVVSLESLWILINSHGLDYPLFYEKLYGVLSPDLFFTRDRRKYVFRPRTMVRADYEILKSHASNSYLFHRFQGL